MKRYAWVGLVIGIQAGCMLTQPAVQIADGQNWPPALPGAKYGTVTLKSPLFLQTPTNVVALAREPDAAAFTVARTPPTVELAYHGQLPDAALNGTGWSAWGDISVADDGMVYCGIGDHGNETAQTSRAYIYQWDPAKKTLKQIADVNAIVKREHGEPTWSKIHARVEVGPDGNVYFTGTLNDGNRANQPIYKWSKAIPGGQLYQYESRTGKTSVFADLPPARCTATALIDRERGIWWCNLEAGPNALYALDLKTKKAIYQAPDGSMLLNRNFALARDGAVYFNGANGIWKCDARAGAIAPTGCSLGSNTGMRASTLESKDGWIYGVGYPNGQLFRFAPAKNKLELLGPNFLKGEYTTACVLAPDERFVYFLPGAHGGAFKYGTPVIQYNVATGERKVIAFMREAFEKSCNYVPAGTYGVKISADGSALYVNFNGHAADAIRPAKMPASGFGLTAFAAIHIPASER
jgi:sugar lactone lactonase YvrE